MFFSNFFIIIIKITTIIIIIIFATIIIIIKKNRSYTQNVVFDVQKKDQVARIGVTAVLLQKPWFAALCRECREIHNIRVSRINFEKIC